MKLVIHVVNVVIAPDPSIKSLSLIALIGLSDWREALLQFPVCAEYKARDSIERKSLPAEVLVQKPTSYLQSYSLSLCKIRHTYEGTFI